MPKPFQIRAVTADDLPLLEAVDPRMTDDPKRNRNVAGLVNLGFSWLAARDGEPVGFAIVSDPFYAFPFIDLLVVAEAHRRAGVGFALMDHCEAAHDADRIFTSTNESNDPMRRLLARSDWLVTGIVENLDPGDPELIFVKFRARA
ncbi:MAG: GNAT family N-acetyltransferase [Caulobacterales bacterium]